ncbi:MAG: protein translocase subunit SecF [Exiguobacterium alkaliphilum]|uniref:Protein-export membrane protein SecF n=1 Tax=Exiguobacterium alkaliphilum TaxID=1428684 RepID=A0ABT2KUB4_9BACL|nr:protein translocase subunit SecF [Exiguobacterium alkaliphilum]MCT4794567.1 protein translocase subunit SecF [Exiguobacterium alkaliphilum]QUE85859.1 protein translocase subunit SecF [Exiguobacterium alkaliphilum]
MNFKLTEWNYVKHMRTMFLVSCAIVIIGLGILLFRGLNLGIDFASGTRVEVQTETQVSQEELEAAFREAGVDESISSVQYAEGGTLANVTFVGQLGQQDVASVKDVFTETFGSDPNISTVSAEVGRDIARNAIYAVALASLGIILYITFRFEFSYAVATVVAMLHDAFFMIVAFSIFGIEVNLYFVAAILTIIGYSVNDTIVTFDRVRENIQAYEKERKIKSMDVYRSIINQSIQETIVRSVNTVITVLLTALALYVFGAESIRGFSVALLVGLFMGMYSSIFIASYLWLLLKKMTLNKKKAEPAPEA